MEIKVDSENHLTLNPKTGRILQLRLHGKTVIKQAAENTGSGNFLMFPWVNRVEDNPFTVLSEYFDGNVNPIHGLYVNDARHITVTPTEHGISVELVPHLTVEGVPKFKEHYLLQKDSLKVSIEVEQSQNIELPFCFGYHPYLQIDNEELKELHLTSDIKTELSLDEALLPVFPYQRSEVALTSAGNYDSLFEGGSFLKLQNKDGFSVQIRSSLPYWQIYTPSDGRRIAVEPMSFTANVYKISESGFKPTLTSGSFVIIAQQEHHHP